MEAGSSAPKKVKVVPSADGTTLTFITVAITHYGFLGAQGIILIDFHQKGNTVNGEYYATLLDHFNQ